MIGTKLQGADLAGAVEAVQRLRDDLGRAKLVALLRAEGFATSESTVRRILRHLVARGAVQPVPLLRRATTRATSSAAASFLDQILAEMPFPVTALQVDGGSEFMAAFETACQAKQLDLFVLPPKSPKLNGGVSGSDDRACAQAPVSRPTLGLKRASEAGQRGRQNPPGLDAEALAEWVEQGVEAAFLFQVG